MLTAPRSLGTAWHRCWDALRLSCSTCLHDPIKALLLDTPIPTPPLHPTFCIVQHCEGVSSPFWEQGQGLHIETGDQDVGLEIGEA